MKKLGASAFVLLFVCCQNHQTSTQTDTLRQNIDTIVQARAIDTALAGIYKVILPCSDCEGREHILALYKTGDFRLQESFIGKSLSPAVTRGNWWRNGDELQLLDGNIIINTYELRKDTLVLQAPGNRREDYLVFALRKMNPIVPVGWQKYKDSGVVFMASGTEPFWGVKITNKTAGFQLSDWPRPVEAPIIDPQQETDSTVYTLNAGKKPYTITIYPLFCSDGMSDIVYEYQVRLQYDSLVLKGCGAYTR